MDIRNKIFDKVDAQIYKIFWDQIRDKVWDKIRDQVSDDKNIIFDKVHNGIRLEVGGRLHSQVSDLIRNSLE